MGTYRVREIEIIDAGDGAEKVKPLREYELESTDERAAIEKVRHFLELEILGPKALEAIDFGALVIIDSSDVEIARFRVSDVWEREAGTVNSGKTYSHWV